MTWTFSIFISVICFSTHIIALRLLADKLPASLITPAFYSFAIFVLFAYFFIEKPKFEFSQLSQGYILIPIVLAGITIALTDLFLVKSLSLDADVSVAMPILLGGSTALALCLSAVFFQEVISFSKIIGVLLAITGIFLIYKA